MYFSNGNSLGFSYAGGFALGLFSSYAKIPDASGFAWTAGISSNPDTAIWRTAQGNLEVGNSNTANNNGFFVNKIINVTQLTATAALTAGQTVKIDTANGSAVVVGTTADTGGGVIAGIVQNSPGAAGTAFVVASGLISTPVLGTGTCSIGQFVIQDTTTNGRVKCTSTYTARTEIGVNLATQNSVGSTVSMMVQIR